MRIYLMKKIINIKIATVLTGLLCLIFLPINMQANETKSFSYNSHLLEVTYNPVNHALYYWNAQGELVKTEKVNSGFLFDDPWFQNAGFKMVTGNSTSYVFDSGDDGKANLYRNEVAKISVGPFSRANKASATPPQAFNFVGDLNTLTNSTQNVLTWENTSSSNSGVAYQQLLKRSTGNVWEVRVDQIGPNINSLAIETLGGEYVIRKISSEGGFVDSNKENSNALKPDDRYIKKITVDLIPPQIVSANPVTSQTDENGRVVYEFTFSTSEPATLFFNVSNHANEAYFSFNHEETDKIAFTWDGRNNLGAKQDGQYIYSYYLKDKAGNHSSTSTGNIIFDTLPPSIQTEDNLFHAVISPNGDGHKDQLDYKFTFSEPSTTLFKLEDSKNVVIYSTSSNAAVTSQSVTLTGAQFLNQADGIYGGKIVATDEKGLSSEMTLSITLDTKTPSISTLNTVLVTTQEATGRLDYEVDEPGLSTLTLAGRVITQNAITGENTLTISLDHILEGLHEAILVVTDEGGNRATKNVTFAYDKTPPSNITLNLPEKLNLKEAIPFSFSANDNVSTVLVGALTIQKTAGAPIEIGSRITPDVTIDIKQSILTAFPEFQDGKYLITLKVTDEVGHDKQVTTSIVAGMTPPVLKLDSLGPISFLNGGRHNLPFEATNGDFQTLKKVTLSLFQNDKLITKILEKTNQVVGKQTISFDGKHNGQLLADGIYSMRLNVESELGLTSSVDATIDIDHSPPKLTKITVVPMKYNHKGDAPKISATLNDRTGRFNRVTLSFEGEIIETIESVETPDIEFNLPIEKAGTALSDGEFTAEIEVEDLAGNKATETIKYTIDTQSPSIQNLVISPDLIIRDSEVNNNYIEITFSSDELSKVSIEVSNKEGQVVKLIKQDDLKTSWSVTWDGFHDAGTMEDGSYFIQAFLEDEAGNTTTSDVLQVSIQANLPAISDIELSIPKVKPGVTTEIRFNTSNDGNVFGQIENGKGELLKILADNLPVIKGSNTISWDGKNQQNDLLPDGDYYVVLWLQTKGLDTPPLKKRIEVDGTPPLLSDISINKPYLTYAQEEDVSANVEIFETVQIVAEVLNAQSAVVTVVENAEYAKGKHELSWDGLNSGKQLAKGTYTLRITVEDEAMNQTQKSASFEVVDYSQATVSYDRTYYVFSPDGDAINEQIQSTIQIQGTGEKAVTSIIKSSSGKVIKSLLNETNTLSKMFVISWDGKDDKDVKQLQGTYTMETTSVDGLGISTLVSVPVYLVLDPLSLTFSDNGPDFSFNDDGIKDQLAYSFTINYPNLLFESDKYVQASELKVQVKQNGNLIKEEILQLTNKYNGTFDGDGLFEGTFQIELSGEATDRITMPVLINQYNNDLSPPQAAQINYIFDSGLGATSLDDTRLQSSLVFNVDTVSFFITSLGATYLEFFDDTGTITSTAISTDGVFLIKDIKGVEGTNNYFIETVDNAGNRTTKIPLEFLIDLTNPKLTSEDIDGLNQLKAGSYTISLSFSEALDTTTPLDVVLKSGSTEISATQLSLTTTQYQGLLTINASDQNKTYQLQVKNLTDKAGNQVTTNATASYVIDTLVPEAPTLNSALLLTNSTTFTDTLTVEVGSSVKLFVDGVLSFTQLNSAASVPISLTLGEGTRVITSTVTDAAGNTSAEMQHTVEVDLTAPTLTLESMEGLSYLKAGTYTISLDFSEDIDAAQSVSVSLSGETATSLAITGNKATGTLTIPQNTTNGSFSLLLVNFKDLAGNTVTVSSPQNYTIDTITPAPPIFQQSVSLINTSQYQNNIAAEIGAIVTMYVDGTISASWIQSQAEEATAILLSEGTHTITATASDTAGNISSISSQTIEVDLTSIQLTNFQMETPSPVSANRYTISLSFSETVDSGRSPDITIITNSGTRRTVSKTSYSGTAFTGNIIFFGGDDGQSVIEVDKVYDLAGNKMDLVTQDAYLVDTAAPAAPLFGSGISLIKSLTYSNLIKAEVGSQVAILLDGNPASNYTQVNTSDNFSVSVTEGSHTVSATAKDSAGNKSAVGQSSFTVDTTPVTMTSESIEGKSLFKAGTYTVTIQFSDPVQAGFTVNLKSAGTTKPVSLTQLTSQQFAGTVTFAMGEDDAFTLEVKNIQDVAGNNTSLTGSLQYTLDTQILPPTFTESSKTLVNTTQYQNSVEVFEDGTVVTVYVDNRQISQFTQDTGIIPRTFSLPSEGTYEIKLVAQDPAGNISSDYIFNVTTDLTKPMVSNINLISPTLVKAETVQFQIQFSEAITSPIFKLKTTLNQEKTVTISSIDAPSNTYTLQSTFSFGDDGLSTIEVSSAIDAAGNTIDTISFDAFTVDATPPTVTQKLLLKNDPVSNGQRDVEIQVIFSELVSSNFTLNMGTDLVDLVGNHTGTTVHFDVPTDLEGTAILHIKNITDTAGNAIADDTSFSFQLDSVLPDVSVTTVTAAINTGTVSNLTVNGTFTEPIQSAPFGLILEYQDNSTINPESLTIAANRQSFTAVYSIRAVEETLKLNLTNLKDDANNNRATKILYLDDIDNIAPEILSLSTNLPKFSAIRNAGEAEVIITLNITGTYDDLSITVTDKAGNHKKTLWGSQNTGFGGQLTWDGKDDSGNYLAKGWYKLRARATDEAGNQSNIQEGLYEITEQYLDLTTAEDIKIPYSFMAQGPRGFVYQLNSGENAPDLADKPAGFHAFTISNPVAKVTEEIYKVETGSDTLIATLKTNDQREEGSHTATWTGRANNATSGFYSNSGDYYLKIQVRTMKDVFQKDIIIPFKVDHSSPTISTLVYSNLTYSKLIAGNHELAVTANISDNMSTSNLEIKLEFSLVTKKQEKTDQKTGSHRQPKYHQYTFSNNRWQSQHHVHCLRRSQKPNHTNLIYPIR